MTAWVYSRQRHAKHATERLLWQHRHDWLIFKYSASDRWVLNWLRSLGASDLSDYCLAMPCLTLGLQLNPELAERAEALKARRRQASMSSIAGLVADASVVRSLHHALDDMFGNRGRRSEDGMRLHLWRVESVEFEFEYRLRSGSALELELSHPTIQRLLPSMMLGTPTSFRVYEQADVESAVRYIGAWLEEVATLVRADL